MRLSHDSLSRLVSMLFMCVLVNFRNFNVSLLHDSMCVMALFCALRGVWDVHFSCIRSCCSWIAGRKWQMHIHIHIHIHIHVRIHMHIHMRIHIHLSFVRELEHACQLLFGSFGALLMLVT